MKHVFNDMRLSSAWPTVQDPAQGPRWCGHVALTVRQILHDFVCHLCHCLELLRIHIWTSIAVPTRCQFVQPLLYVLLCCLVSVAQRCLPFGASLRIAVCGEFVFFASAGLRTLQGLLELLFIEAESRLRRTACSVANFGPKCHAPIPRLRSSSCGARRLFHRCRCFAAPCRQSACPVLLLAYPL